MRLVAEIQLTTAQWRATGTNHGDTNVWAVISVACIVGTNEWLLDGNLVENGRIKWYYDGTTLFQSLQTVKELPADLTKGDKKFGFVEPPLEITRSNLTINVFNVPGDYGYPGSGVAGHIPWLAFCSGPYLGRNGRRIPIPTSRSEPVGGLSASELSCVDDTTTYKDGLGLPLRMDLYCDNDDRKTRTTSTAENRRRRFHYVVTASTNYAGWNFPLRFEFGDDMPEELGSGIQRNTQGSGRLISISDSPKPEGVFDSSLQQTVVDWRFSSQKKAINAIVYQKTNSLLLPTNDPSLQALFKSRLSKVGPRQSIRKQRVRLIILTILTATVVVPFAVMGFRKWSESNHHNKKHI